jgi:hypothetical protein
VLCNLSFEILGTSFQTRTWFLFPEKSARQEFSTKQGQSWEEPQPAGWESQADLVSLENCLPLALVFLSASKDDYQAGCESQQVHRAHCLSAIVGPTVGAVTGGRKLPVPTRCGENWGTWGSLAVRKAPFVFCRIHLET